MSPRILVVGDALLDVDVTGSSNRLSPDAPVPVVEVTDERCRPGGAGLTAVFSRLEGAEVTLVSGVGTDADGDCLMGELDRAGIDTVPLPLTGATPVKKRVRVSDQSLLRLDNRAGRVASGDVDPAGLLPELVRESDVVVVADYGRGTASHPQVRQAVMRGSSVVWDPHPNGAVPVPGARVVLPNEREAHQFAQLPAGSSWAGAGRAADQLIRSWQVGAVCVTMGPRGALLSYGSGPAVVVPTTEVAGDPCGAGDRFTAAVAAALADGAVLAEAVQVAVGAAAEHVRSGTSLDGSAPATGRELDPIERVRARGGTVVATGGCFDLLHAGHVQVLTQARALGDCLMVAINSDESVARLKGPGRPIVPLADRMKVLQSLACVDAVVAFGGDTPEDLLREWRPDIWVKGGDYAAGVLPEAAVVESWGGEAVTVPYLSGRSTSSLVVRLRDPEPIHPSRTEENQ